MDKRIIIATVLFFAYIFVPSYSFSDNLESPSPVFYLILNSGADLVDAPIEIVSQRNQLTEYMRYHFGRQSNRFKFSILDISSPSDYFENEPDVYEYLMFLEVMGYYRSGPWRHLVVEYEVVNRDKETLVIQQRKTETVKSYKKSVNFLNDRMTPDVLAHLPGGKKYIDNKKPFSQRLLKPKSGKKVKAKSQTNSPNTIEERLIRLKELRTKGLITDREYNKKRAEIIDEI